MKSGQISRSMGVDTKPAHKFTIDKYWVLVDPNMPEAMFEKLKASVENQKQPTKSK